MYQCVTLIISTGMKCGFFLVAQNSDFMELEFLGFQATF